MKPEGSSVCRMERAVPSALPRAGRIELRAARSTSNFLLLSYVTSSLFLGVSLLSSCKREQRVLVVQPPSAQQPLLQQMSDLAPGPKHRQVPSLPNPDENNSWSMSEGKRLYEAYNCVGCHAHGGGGMGPALMDEKWIYGHEPQQVYATIVEGRPNGMPSFRGKIPNEQVWEIVAYVRSLSGLANQWAANGRDDHIKGPPPPNSVPEGTPHNSSEPQPK
jgi:cytochrome c oxidase cbb3-type subunit III